MAPLDFDLVKADMSLLVFIFLRHRLPTWILEWNKIKKIPSCEIFSHDYHVHEVTIGDSTPQ